MPHKMGEIELIQQKPWDIILERFRNILRYDGHLTRLIGTHIFRTGEFNIKKILWIKIYGFSVASANIFCSDEMFQSICYISFQKL